MRAFKLGTNQKKISTPEISAVDGTTIRNRVPVKSVNIVNKSSSSKRFLMQIKNQFKKGCADS